jgi:ABC-2 type transport system permease protein
LQQPLKVTVYLKGDNFPSAMKKLQRSTRDMLSDLQAYSNGQLTFEFTDPVAKIKDLSQDQQEAAYDTLESKGIIGQNYSVKTDNGLSQMMIFPQALVQYQGKTIPVSLMQSRIGLSDDEVVNNSIQKPLILFFITKKKKHDRW